MTADELADIKPKLEAAKKKPISFAACLGRSAQTTVIHFSKTKDPKMMVAAAKKAGETNKTTFGTVTYAEGVVLLACADEVPTGLCKLLRGLFAAQKVSAKVRALDPSGKPADLDEDDIPGTTAPGTVAPTTDGGQKAEALPGGQQTPAGTETQESDVQPNTGTDRDSAWDKVVANVQPRVIDYVKSGAEKAKQVGAAWKAAVASAQAGKLDDAMTVVSKILPLLRTMDESAAPGPMSRASAEIAPVKPVQPEPVSPTPVSPEPGQQPKPVQPEGPNIDFGKAAKVWQETVKAMHDGLAKLQGAIANHLDPDPSLASVKADVPSLSNKLIPFDLDLVDTLEEAAGETEGIDALIAEARGHLRRYAAALDDPFFKVVDADNGFVPVAVAAPARRAVAALERMLG